MKCSAWCGVAYCSCGSGVVMGWCGLVMVWVGDGVGWGGVVRCGCFLSLSSYRFGVLCCFCCCFVSMQREFPKFFTFRVRDEVSMTDTFLSLHVLVLYLSVSQLLIFSFCSVFLSQSVHLLYPFSLFVCSLCPSAHCLRKATVDEMAWALLYVNQKYKTHTNLFSN